MQPKLWNALCRRSKIQYLLAGLIFSYLLSASGLHIINVRLVDAANGKPVRKVTALLLKWNTQGQVEKLAEGTANDDGAIAFTIPDPVPNRIGISFSPDEVKNCSEVAFLTQGILANGVVGENNCVKDGKKPSVKSKAGELTVFVRRVTLWERMRREIP